MKTSESSSASTSPSPNPSPYRLIAFTVLLVALLAVASAAFVLATDVFLILFLAVLFGVFLTHLSQRVSRLLPLGYKASLAVVVVLLILVSAGTLVFFGARVDQKLQHAGQHLDSVQQRLQQIADDHPVVRTAVSSTPVVRQLLPSDQGTDQKKQKNPISSAEAGTNNDDANGDEPAARSEAAGAQNSADAGDSSSQQSSQKTQQPSESGSGAGQLFSGGLAQKVASTVSSAFRTTFGLVVNLILIFFVGLFIAVAPGEYRDGVALLFPKDRRDRVREIMDTLGQTLWEWLKGRFGSMTITGIGAAILLASLQVPLGISLGILTGLLTFVPNIGSLVSLMLATLFALPLGGTTVLAVIGGYLLLQLVESYVITPLIQQKQVSLPPALLIATQAVMGVLFGFLGAAVASPMLAVAKKGTEIVYIDDNDDGNN